MRAFKRYSNRGFTLVELMIVVAIIGVLAALAIYGVRRYLASAKTAEAKNSLGAMERGAVGSYEREYGDTTAILPGAVGDNYTHDVCNGSTNNVPGTALPPAGKKYTPTMVAGCDYETGDAVTGWKCLKFNMSSPSYYQYGYAANPRNTALTAHNTIFTGLAVVAVPGFSAMASGDLDGDSTTSSFGLAGDINITTQQLYVHPEIQVVDEYE